MQKQHLITSQNIDTFDVKKLKFECKRMNNTKNKLNTFSKLYIKYETDEGIFPLIFQTSSNGRSRITKFTNTEGSTFSCLINMMDKNERTGLETEKTKHEDKLMKTLDDIYDCCIAALAEAGRKELEKPSSWFQIIKGVKRIHNQYKEDATPNMFVKVMTQEAGTNFVTSFVSLDVEKRLAKNVVNPSALIAKLSSTGVSCTLYGNVMIESIYIPNNSAAPSFQLKLCSACVSHIVTPVQSYIKPPEGFMTIEGEMDEDILGDDDF